jgi:hypothetical protein
MTQRRTILQETPQHAHPTKPREKRSQGDAPDPATKLAAGLRLEEVPKGAVVVNDDEEDEWDDEDADQDG